MTRKRAKDKTICLDFVDEGYYKQCMNDDQEFRRHVGQCYQQWPELFPAEFEGSYRLHGFITSKKQGLKMRRIRLSQNGAAYQIRPSFMMPYMIGPTEEIGKGLYFKRWGVPFEALAYAFGHDAMFWYRAYLSLGRYSLVGTTVKQAEQLPQDVVADEKHTRRQGEKVYLATTVAQECILGADIAPEADTLALSKSYQVFKTETQHLDPTYSPQTVNTDGWSATQNAWQLLFPRITIILCFLHAFLAIRNSCRGRPEVLKQISHKVWHAYHAPKKAHFSQRIRRLREWSRLYLAGPAQSKVLALCHKAPCFKIAYHFPSAYRTSNALDRLMNYQDRLLYDMQYLHGSLPTAQLYVRAMALVWNFHPYGRQTQAKYVQQITSPFQALNGFHYHSHWLHNLLISASLQRQPPLTQIPL